MLAAFIGVIVLFSACTAGYDFVTASREKAGTPAWTGTQMAIEIVVPLQELNRILGITILLVTHEPDIATDTPRILHIRDSLLGADEPVSNPRSAVVDLTARDSRADSYLAPIVA